MSFHSLHYVVCSNRCCDKVFLGCTVLILIGVCLWGCKHQCSAHWCTGVQRLRACSPFAGHPSHFQALAVSICTYICRFFACTPTQSFSQSVLAGDAWFWPAGHRVLSLRGGPPQITQYSSHCGSMRLVLRCDCCGARKSADKSAAGSDQALATGTETHCTVTVQVQAVLVWWICHAKLLLHLSDARTAVMGNVCCRLALRHCAKYTHETLSSRLSAADSSSKQLRLSTKKEGRRLGCDGCKTKNHLETPSRLSTVNRTPVNAFNAMIAHICCIGWTER